MIKISTQPKPAKPQVNATVLTDGQTVSGELVDVDEIPKRPKRWRVWLNKALSVIPVLYLWYLFLIGIKVLA